MSVNNKTMVKFFKSDWNDAIPFLAFWILQADHMNQLWPKVLAGVLTVYWAGVIIFRYCWND